MYLGRIQHGDWLPLTLASATSALVPTAPTSAPTCLITDDTGATEATVTLCCKDKTGQTGYFDRSYQVVSSTHPAGRKFLIFRWVISGTTYRRVACVDVVAGGNSKGTIAATAVLNRPEGDVVFLWAGDGTLNIGRNPR